MGSQRETVLPAVLAVGTDGADASDLASALSAVPFDVTVAAGEGELRRTLAERQVACVLCQHVSTDPVPRTIVETVGPSRRQSRSSLSLTRNTLCRHWKQVRQT